MYIAQNNMFIGLDVGATKIAAGLVTSQGKIIKQSLLKTKVQKGKKVILNNIVSAVEKIWDKKVRAIGIGMAGQCNAKDGIFLSGPNFPSSFRNINFKKFFEKKFNVRTSLDNDAHCFTLAESIYGAGKNYKYVVGITLGTGIGGGIVINKKIFRGACNTAGEFGHMTIDISSPFRCSCGKFGHFEALASGKAIEKIYQSFSGKTLSSFEIEKLRRKKDKIALQVVALMTKSLVLALANIIHAINPEIIIIGGGITKMDIPWNRILQEVKNNVIYKSLKSTKITISKLGDKAGILGAALLCREK